MKQGTCTFVYGETIDNRGVLSTLYAEAQQPNIPWNSATSLTT